MNLLYLFLLWSVLFQFANGEISVTLINENESPVAQETIEFVTEEQQVLASCVTNSQGRCTITIENAPTDASGFIRGSLLLSDRGRRPVLWPGGQIEIQIMLEGGKVDIPSDAYVTRTPRPEATPTVQEQLEATPTVQEQLEATPTVQEQLEVTPTVQEQSEATPTVQEQSEATPTVQEQLEATPTVQEQLEATPTVQEQLEATPTASQQNENELAQQEQQTNISSSIWFQAFLFIILVIALGFYIWPTNKKS